jgi:hypothetical protein
MFRLASENESAKNRLQGSCSKNSNKSAIRT